MNKYVLKEGHSEIIINKSRFIGLIKNVESEEEALSLIAAVKKEYWDARHNCYAYIISGEQEIKRFSDDGEPQGTAGKPILDVLERQNIKNAVIIVTRYFGGVLLGTGGLVRAYGSCSIEAVNNADVCEEKEGTIITIEADYTASGKIQYALRQVGGVEIGTEYADKVKMIMCVEKEFEKKFLETLTEITKGNIKDSQMEKVKFTINNGEFIRL